MNLGIWKIDLNSEVLVFTMKGLKNHREMEIYHVGASLIKGVDYGGGAAGGQPSKQPPMGCLLRREFHLRLWSAGAERNDKESSVVHWFYREELGALSYNLLCYFTHSQ